MEKIIPELVRRNSNGNLMLNYIGLFPVIIEGMKEHVKRTEEERKEAMDRICLLEKKISELGFFFLLNCFIFILTMEIEKDKVQFDWKSFENLCYLAFSTLFLLAFILSKMPSEF